MHLQPSWHTPFGLSLPFLRQAQDDRKYKLRTIGKPPFGLSLSKPCVELLEAFQALRQPFDAGPRQARSLLRANGGV
jgi:hypothetical protein